MSEKKPLEAPKSLKRIGDTDEFEITAENGRTKRFKTTKTSDGSHLFIINGSGLDTWKISNLFPAKGEHDDSIAIAVLNKDGKLAGIGLGHGNTGTVGLLPTNGHVTINAILSNDGTVSKFDERHAVKVTIERYGDNGNNTKINDKNAEQLNRLIKASMAMGSGTKKKSAIDKIPEYRDAPKNKFEYEKFPGVTEASAGEHKKPLQTPTVVAAASAKDKSNYLS